MINNRFILFLFFLAPTTLLYASFPVEAQELSKLVEDPKSSWFKIWPFIIGILTVVWFPWNLLLLFVKQKNFRKNLILGWLTGLILLILLNVNVESGGIPLAY